MIAQEVFDLACNLLNDPQKTNFNYINLMGPLKIAYSELQGEIKVRNLPIMAGKTSLITVLTGALTLNLPSDFSVSIELHERDSGSSDKWDEMEQVRFLPDCDQTTSLRYWEESDGAIRFLGATKDKQVRLRYTKNLNAIVDHNSTIDIPDSLLVLASRTAAIAADFNGRMPAIADRLNAQTLIELDRYLRPRIKEMQNLPVRRARFRRG